jgi:lysophospholipid acyltransferase
MYFRTSFARQKYYFAWYVAEGASIMAGIGYEGKDANGTMRWRRLKNADPIKVEFAVNMYSITMYWNMRTALWLRLYVYNRLNSYSAKSWQKRFSTYLTMMTSAFWHGFYPGYYIFFITSAIYTELGRDIRRVIRPLFVKEPQKSSLLYDTITRFFTGIYLNYAGASFLLLDGWRGLQLFSGLYYFVHITSIVLLIALRSPPLSRIGRKEKAK